MKIYLHQFLSKSGRFASKKDVLSVISGGEVSVDGRVVSDPAFQFNTTKRVKYRGKPLRIKQGMTFILNKPEGYLSSKLSPTDIRLGKRSVFELIDLPPDEKNALFIIGRLDEDTSGLLILTSDGKLGSRLTDPKHGVRKTYLAVLRDSLSEEDWQAIESGVEIALEENGKISWHKTRPCKVTVGSDRKSATIVITDGKKREVRRIFEAVGNSVVSLERTAIGRLELSSLGVKKGEYRAATEAELSLL
jgi:pseudouridine synthase